MRVARQARPRSRTAHNPPRHRASRSALVNSGKTSWKRDQVEGLGRCSDCRRCCCYALLCCKLQKNTSVSGEHAARASRNYTCMQYFAAAVLLLTAQGTANNNPSAGRILDGARMQRVRIRLLACTRQQTKKTAVWVACQTCFANRERVLLLRFTGSGNGRRTALVASLGFLVRNLSSQSINSPKLPITMDRFCDLYRRPQNYRSSTIHPPFHQSNPIQPTTEDGGTPTGPDDDPNCPREREQSKASQLSSFAMSGIGKRAAARVGS